MNKLDLDLDKIITSFDEVQDILNKVLSKMDEPKLKNKNIKKHIVSEKEMIEIMRLSNLEIKESINENQFKRVYGVCVSNKKNPNYFYLGIKQNNFATFFMTYFHELGHIANNEFKKVKLSRLETVVIDESLAESFAYWATEEFNKIYSLKFKDIRIILSAEIEEQKIPEKLYQVTEEKIILTKLLLDFHNIFGSSKKTYEKIQDLAYNHPTELAKLIYDCYISNK